MATKTEKMLLLLKYLKRFTDERNPTSMPLIDYYFEKKKGKNFFGSPSAKRKVKHQIVKELAEYLNTDSDGNLLPKEDWVIVYDGYGEEKTNDREFICNLYYNQPFSEEEVKIIEKSIDFNTELDDERKEQLKQKIKKRLYNKYYGKPISFLKNRGPIERKQYFVEQEKLYADVKRAMDIKRAKQDREFYDEYYDDF